MKRIIYLSLALFLSCGADAPEPSPSHRHAKKCIDAGITPGRCIRAMNDCLKNGGRFGVEL